MDSELALGSVLDFVAAAAAWVAGVVVAAAVAGNEAAA